MKKEVSGQSVTLKVKNRSGEYIQNVLITDDVPADAFISCGMTPRIERLASEDHLTWFAAMDAGEEITINYQATQTSEDFFVKIGDEEYHSGYGLMSVLGELRSNILPKKKPAPAPVA